MTDTKIVEYVEQNRIIMRVYKKREDQMGDTTRDIVLAEVENKLSETGLKSAIENCRYRPI